MNENSRKTTGPGKYALVTRYIVIAAIALILLMPLSMIESVIYERHGNYRSVLRDIGNRWGKEQEFIGPLLVVPYVYRYQITESKLNKLGEYQDITRTVQTNSQAVFLPDTLTVRGKLKPEYRKRGIYQSLVYRLDLGLQGTFSNINARLQQIVDKTRLHQVQWDKAFLSIGLTDPSGVEAVDKPVIGHRDLEYDSGSGITGLLATGLHIPLELTQDESSSPLPFNLHLHLKGSSGFKAATIGERTDMHLESTWEHPGFYGDLLPAGYSIDPGKGFQADWSVTRLVRSYPQQWLMDVGNHNIREMNIGVRLFEPVTLYTNTTRAVKYGILFVLLTFATLLIIEKITAIQPGLVQYLLIGISLSLFYLLLIAFAEHIGFGAAYLLASLIVICMICLYALAILKKRSLAGLIGSILIALYSVLYLILQSEDYALLSGALLVTLTLCAGMYFTRNTHSTVPTSQAMEQWA